MLIGAFQNRKYDRHPGDVCSVTSHECKHAYHAMAFFEARTVLQRVRQWPVHSN